MNGKHLFKIYFCDFINVFTDSYGQFNALLLNKIYLFILSFLKTILNDPKPLNGSVNQI